MQLIISILILFILVNCVLKLSFWRIWQAALFGAIVRRLRRRDLPVRHSAIEDAAGRLLPQNTTALQNMAVIITLESVVSFAYCIAVLRGWFRTTGTVVGETPEVVPQPTRLPRAVLPADRIGVQFSRNVVLGDLYAFAAAVVVLFPLLCHLFPAPAAGKGDATGDALSGEPLRLHHRSADHRQRQCNLSGGR